MSDHFLVASLIVLFASAFLIVSLNKKIVRASLRTLRHGSRTLALSRVGFIVAILLAVLGFVLGIGSLVPVSLLVLIGTLMFSLFSLFWLRIPTSVTEDPATVLVVAAHPDDLEIACGATIAKLADSGHRVFGLVMTAGEAGGDSSVRPDEARNGAQFLGMEDVRVLNLTDRYLEAETHDMVDAIENAIRQSEPDLILTHSSNDVHQDHAAVHAAVLRAARHHHSIICFESPSVTNDFAPSIYIDVTDYSDVKNLAVASHADQMDKPYMARDVIDGITAFRGRQARVKRAEAFEVVRLQLNQPLPL